MPTCTMLAIPTLVFPASGAHHGSQTSAPARQLAWHHDKDTIAADRCRCRWPRARPRPDQPQAIAGAAVMAASGNAALAAAATTPGGLDPREGAIMFILPVQAGRAAADRPARILVIGRSESVLSEAVTILREKGYAAGATNEFDRILDLFDAGLLDLVVFGGMVPPDTKDHLREQILARNPAVAF